MYTHSQKYPAIMSIIRASLLRWIFLVNWHCISCTVLYKFCEHTQISANQPSLYVRKCAEYSITLYSITKLNLVTFKHKHSSIKSSSATFSFIYLKYSVHPFWISYYSTQLVLSILLWVTAEKQTCTYTISEQCCMWTPTHKRTSRIQKCQVHCHVPLSLL